MSVEITNRHKRHVIKGSMVELVQRFEYECGGGRQRMTKQTIAKLVKGAVAPLSTQIWEEEELLVPKDAVASFLRGCDRISVHYEVVFSLRPGIHIAVPIIVGTKPFDGAALKKIVQALPWKSTTAANDPPNLKSSPFDHPLPPPFVGFGLKSGPFNGAIPPLVPPHVRLPMAPPPPPPPSRPPPMMFTTAQQHFAHSKFPPAPAPPPPPPPFPHRCGGEFGSPPAANWPFTTGHQPWPPQFALYKEDEDDKHVLKIEEIE